MANAGDAELRLGWTFKSKASCTQQQQKQQKQQQQWLGASTAAHHRPDLTKRICNAYTDNNHAKVLLES